MTEFFHNVVALLLRHITVHGTHGKIRLAHFFGQPIDLTFGVAEDHCLCDGKRIVQVTESIELPLFTFDCDEELFDAFQRQLITVKD